MANTKSALKRHRQSLKRRARNRAATSRLRSAVKALRKAVAENDVEAAKTLLPGTLSLVDVTARKGVIHRNAANRSKSRLQRLVNGASSA